MKLLVVGLLEMLALVSHTVLASPTTHALLPILLPAAKSNQPSLPPSLDNSPAVPVRYVKSAPIDPQIIYHLTYFRSVIDASDQHQVIQRDFNEEFSHYKALLEPHWKLYLHSVLLAVSERHLRLLKQVEALDKPMSVDLEYQLLEMPSRLKLAQVEARVNQLRSDRVALVQAQSSFPLIQALNMPRTEEVLGVVRQLIRDLFVRPTGVRLGRMDLETYIQIRDYFPTTAILVSPSFVQGDSGFSTPGRSAGPENRSRSPSASSVSSAGSSYSGPVYAPAGYSSEVYVFEMVFIKYFLIPRLMTPSRAPTWGYGFLAKFLQQDPLIKGFVPEAEIKLGPELLMLYRHYTQTPDGEKLLRQSFLA
ncbi:hypothetical protein BJ085DRAFT_32406 [Dimargaris cristalligena]|uniref:Uncharacterized protein n=1 Tax=Dimargaris cristalligena TaxID=215637 RepID=A0A4P9ZTT3_9FUNG|nr:hypothetical protein BJ085DRAFT_32406 [Dimargaris cristalligena]|eukprot:RKP36943.1 hypothetical protein BJ085DRAFT_32406 [Dimargaris cristalligena]